MSSVHFTSSIEFYSTLKNHFIFSERNQPNFNMKTAVALAIVAMAACASAIGIGHGIGIAKDLYAYPAYKFNYGVADKLTGDHKNHFEVRDGPVTKGSYSLIQPDGVLRTVNYISTPVGGFQAQVINKGIAGHPAIYGVYGKGIIG